MRAVVAVLVVCWPLTAGAQDLRLAVQRFTATPTIDLGIPAPAVTPTALSPNMLATLGAAADITGTYIGLRVTGTHDDTIGYANMTPGQVAMGLMVQYATQRAIGVLLKRRIPKSRRLVDAINANIGAHQLGLGADWGEELLGAHSALTGYQRVELAFARAAQHR